MPGLTIGGTPIGVRIASPLKKALDNARRGGFTGFVGPDISLADLKPYIDAYKARLAEKEALGPKVKMRGVIKRVLLRHGVVIPKYWGRAQAGKGFAKQRKRELKRLKQIAIALYLWEQRAVREEQEAIALRREAADILAERGRVSITCVYNEPDREPVNLQTARALWGIEGGKYAMEG